MIISIINQNGGVAKTTTTHNLSQSISDAGKKILVIYLILQSSLAISVGLE